MILALAGEPPVSVHTEGSCHLHPSIADTTTMHLRFANGVHAHVYVSRLHPFEEQKLVVIGDKAMAVFDDGLPWQQKLTLFPHSIDWIDGQPEARKAMGQSVELAESEPLRDECRHFLELVAAGTNARTDGREGLAVLAVLEAGQRSRESRSSVHLVNVTVPPRAPDHFFVHPLAAIDDGAEIGKGTRIWHFSHVLKNSRIGENCVIGQNVMHRPRRDDRRPLQDPEQCQRLPRRHLGGWRLLRAVLCLHQRRESARRDRAQERVPADPGEARRHNRSQRHHRLRQQARRILLHRGWRSGDEGCSAVRPGGWRAGPAHRLGQSCRRAAGQGSRLPARGAALSPGRAGPARGDIFE